MTRYSDDILSALSDYKEQLKTGGRIDHRIVSKACEHIEFLDALNESLYRINEIWQYGCLNIEIANEHHGPKSLEQAKKACEETRHEVNGWVQATGAKLNQMKGAP